MPIETIRVPLWDGSNTSSIVGQKFVNGVAQEMALKSQPLTAIHWNKQTNLSHGSNGRTSIANSPWSGVMSFVNVLSNGYIFHTSHNAAELYQLLRSTDAGKAWALVPFISARNLLFSIVTLSSGTLLANHYDGNNVAIVRSTDNGLTWTNTISVDTGLTLPAPVILQDGSNVYTIISKQLYVSTNDGVSFTATGTAIPDGFGVVSSAVCCGNGIFVAVNWNRDQIWKSTDYGATWTKTGDQLNKSINSGNGIRQVVHLGSGVLIAMGSEACNIFKSTDYGSTWTRVGTSDLGWTLRKLLSVGNGIVIAATSSGVYLSCDSGASWAETSSGNIAPYDIAFDPVRNLLYASLNDEGELWTGCAYPTSSPSPGQAWVALPAGSKVKLNTIIIPEIQNIGDAGSVQYQYAVNGGALNGTWLTQTQLQAVSDVIISDTINSFKVVPRLISDGAQRSSLSSFALVDVDLPVSSGKYDKLAVYGNRRIGA